MENIRIIPRLDIKGPNVVKGIHSEGLRVVGSPIDLATRYYEEGADEIIYLDIVASLYQRKIDFEQLKQVSEKIFVPLTVGGGIESLEDIQRVLEAGADKVAINTHAVKNPSFLQNAVAQFGSQCIVLFVEAKKIGEQTWEAYTEGGRERTHKDAIAWMQEAIGYGIGEILITSIDHDGTKRGFELELVEAITSFAKIPIISHGGAGSLESVQDVITDGGTDAVAISSIFHYEDCSIGELKEYLIKQQINVRA